MDPLFRGCSFSLGATRCGGTSTFIFTSAFIFADTGSFTNSFRRGPGTFAAAFPGSNRSSGSIGYSRSNHAAPFGDADAGTHPADTERLA